MAFERRLEAVVLGPGSPGHVRVALAGAVNIANFFSADY